MARITPPSEVARLLDRLAELGDPPVPSGGEVDSGSPANWSLADRDALAQEFHRLWYDLDSQTWRDTHWCGEPVRKSPLDLWIYQELIWEVRPTVVIETGTRFGGSAFYFASILDRVGRGRVVTVDIDPVDPLPVHPRIEYLRGSSVDPEVVEHITSSICPDDVVLVNLDSDHSRDHVLAELEVFAPLVTPGSYVIVEDTNISGHPVRPDHGPGPMEAVEVFFPLHPEFVNDERPERYLMTFHPRGFWKRVSAR